MMTSPVSLTGNLTVGGSGGITFSDSSSQTAAASPYVLKNRLINGAMVIAQYSTSSVTPTNATYGTVDRWQFRLSQASKFTAQQNAGSVTPPTGFTNYLGITSSSSYTVGSSDYFAIQQAVEANNASDFAYGTANAQTVTLSFWVRSSLTGTFGGSIFEYNNGYPCYPFSYTISSANTWTKISVTLTGATSGSFGTGNGGLFCVNFSLGCGSTLQGTANTWNYGTLYRTVTGETQVVGTSGATWYITGVQLELGTSATPFERRLYGQELINCYRYYQKMSSEGVDYGSFGTGGLVGSNTLYLWTPLYIPMRVAPTMSSSAANTFRVDSGNNSGTSISFDRMTTHNYRVIVSTSGISSVVGELHSDSTNTAYIAASAEL
jgi:hypothetical protein